MSTPTPEGQYYVHSTAHPIVGGPVSHDAAIAALGALDNAYVQLPAASAPQGDTAGVIEQARGIAYRALADAPRTRPDGKRFGSIEGDRVRADAVIDAFATAGLLAVAASPAAPQAADEAERWKQAYALKLAEFTRETLRVSAALRICNDRYRTGSGEGGLGYSMAQDDVRKAIESVPAVPASSTPAPADDEAAQVERMAKASWDAADGFVTATPWPPNSAYRVEKERRRARAILAAYFSQSWYIGQEIEWNPTGDEWRSGFITALDGDGALIVLHENAQSLNVDTRHLRPRAALAELKKGQR